MHAISIHQLVKIYATGTQALAGVNLTVEEGDFFALLGMNGAGKTTIIGILTSLVNKTAGTVNVFGYDLDTHMNIVKKQIGVVPQEFNFNIFEKVIDIVVAQGGYYGIPRSIALQRAEHILKKLELWDKKDAVSRTLSGGMKRRLLIARALIHEPRLLILDEPTAGVDVELRRGMWNYLRELNASGVTILLTTHYLEEVEQLCRNAALIHKGKIILHGSVKDLLSTVEQETYVAIVDSTKHIPTHSALNITVIDDHSLECIVHTGQTITMIIKELEKNNIIVHSIRPKSNRMEELFLRAIKP